MTPSGHLLNIILYTISTMRPTPRITFPRTLFVFIVFLLVLYTVLPQFIQPVHDEPLIVTVQTYHFTYRVSTYTNNLSKRCALIRCGPEYANRLYHHSTCDVIFAEVLQANHNASFRLCPIDYINTQWKALSRSYNEGFFYISDDVKLDMPPTDLPTDPKSVHFSMSRNDDDIAVTWIAVKPTHIVRPLFQEWHDVIDNKNITVRRHSSIEIATLNFARSCRSPDVVCHSRSTSIAWQCDSTRNEIACLAPEYPITVIHLAGTALVIVIVLSTIVTTMGQVIPRVRGAFGTPLNAHMVPLKFIHILVVVLVMAMAGENWTFMVKTFARAFGASYKHDLQHEAFTVPAEVYRAIPDLRGLYSGYAYIFSDNEQTVRITGPSVSLVVWATSVMLFMKRVLYGGLLVKGVAAVLMVRAGCDAILMVGGIGKTESSIEDDEYIQFRSDLPGEIKKMSSLSSSRERGSRTFLQSRDRSAPLSNSSSGSAPLSNSSSSDKST